MDHPSPSHFPLSSPTPSPAPPQRFSPSCHCQFSTFKGIGALWLLIRICNYTVLSGGQWDTVFYITSNIFGISVLTFLAFLLISHTRNHDNINQYVGPSATLTVFRVLTDICLISNAVEANGLLFVVLTVLKNYNEKISSIFPQCRHFFILYWQWHEQVKLFIAVRTKPNQSKLNSIHLHCIGDRNH